MRACPIALAAGRCANSDRADLSRRHHPGPPTLLIKHLTLLVPGEQLVLGFLRLGTVRCSVHCAHALAAGAVVDLISHPVISGFISASAIIISARRIAAVSNSLRAHSHRPSAALARRQSAHAIRPVRSHFPLPVHHACIASVRCWRAERFLISSMAFRTRTTGISSSALLHSVCCLASHLLRLELVCLFRSCVDAAQALFRQVQQDEPSAFVLSSLQPTC